MQRTFKAIATAAVLLGASSAAIAAPASQMLAIREPVSAVKRTALPICSRTVTANCAMPGSRMRKDTSLVVLVGGTLAAAAAVAIAAKGSASP